MARLTSLLNITGTLSGLSIYQMRGIENPIVRTKGGATKKQIKKSPNFDLTRRINAEFGGRATATRYIFQAIYPVKPLADYNVAGPINSLVKPIQQLDTTNEYGKRSVQLSRTPHLLSGFSLNKKTGLEQIIRSPFTVELSKENLKADILIPGLLPGINFHPMEKYPVYSIVISLGLVPDLVHSAQRYMPQNKEWINLPCCEKVYTEWTSNRQAAEEKQVTVQFNVTPPDQQFCMLLTIGIRFGQLGVGGEIEQVKYAGAAKVMMAV